MPAASFFEIDLPGFDLEADFESHLRTVHDVIFDLVGGDCIFGTDAESHRACTVEEEPTA